MATLEELVVSLTAETAGLRSELNKAVQTTSKATESMDKAIEEFSKNSSKNMSFFEQATATMAGFLASNVVTGAVNQLKEAFGFLKGELLEGVQRVSETETAYTRLANALATTGQYSESSMQSLQDFASEIKATTGIGDDLVASNLALLSSLTRLDAEGLKAAQGAAIDMASALGMDLNAATQLVAKGINGNTDAFKRYGVEVQKGATDAQTFSNVVNTLNQRFGGSAVGAAETYAGAMLKLSNAYEDVIDEVAKAIVQNPVLIAMVNELAEAFRGWAGSLNETSGTMKNDLATALLTTIEIMGGLVYTIDSVVKAVTIMVQGFVAGLNLIAGSVQFVLDKLGIVENNDPFANLIATSEAFHETVAGNTTLGKLGDTLANIHGAGTLAFQSLGEAAAATKPTVDETTASVEALNNAFETMYNEKLKSFAEGLAQENLLRSEQLRAEQEALQLSLEGQEITRAEYNALRLENMQMAHDAELAQLQAALDQKLLTEEQYQNAKTNLEMKQANETKKIRNDMKKFEDMENKQRVSAFQDAMGQISTLQRSENRKVAAIGKAAAITQAVIAGVLAVQQALAWIPPPASFAVASAVGAAAAMNVAQIAGVDIGFNKGGTVPGTGFSDSVPATLTPGEEVVNRDTSQKLRDFLDRQNGGGSGMGGLNITVSFEGATIIGDVRSSEFGAMVVEAINEAVVKGQTTGLLQRG